MFTEHDKQIENGPYPSATLFKADVESNGCAVPDAESHVKVVGIVKTGREATVVTALKVADPHVSP